LNQNRSKSSPGIHSVNFEGKPDLLEQHIGEFTRTQPLVAV